MGRRAAILHGYLVLITPNSKAIFLKGIMANEF
jgi:hypothetical protein